MPWIRTTRTSSASTSVTSQRRTATCLLRTVRLTSQCVCAAVAEVLKEIDFKLPRRQLEAVIARFDANGDGNVSIPEFAAFMLGRQDLKDELANAPPKFDEESAAPLPPIVSPRGTTAYASRRPREEAPYDMPFDRDAYNHSLRWVSKPLTPRERGFLSRMDGDIGTRRQTFFENEMQKAEEYRGFMSTPRARLEPLRTTRFQEGNIDWSSWAVMGGPVIKTHDRKRTAYEPRRPFKWGQLGGWDY